MEKQLGWSCKLDEVGHTVLARVIESQIWHQSMGSMGGGLSNGTMSSAHLHARHFSLSLYTTGH